MYVDEVEVLLREIECVYKGRFKVHPKAITVKQLYIIKKLSFIKNKASGVKNSNRDLLFSCQPFHQCDVEIGKAEGPGFESRLNFVFFLYLLLNFHCKSINVN